MESAIKALKKLRGLFLIVAETGLTLVGVALVLYLLMGENSGEYVLSVVTNVSLLVDAISPQAIVSLALIVGAIALIKNRM